MKPSSADFGAANPIGRQIGVEPRIPEPGKTSSATVVGVVGEQEIWKLDADPGLVVYQPFRQYGFLRRVDLVAEITGKVPPLDKIVAQVDPSQAAYDLKTLEQALCQSVAPRRFNLMLLTVFASVALVLALVGIYGVMSYAVNQRTHEIGVRMALGAQRGEVVGMVVRGGMAVAAAGMAARVVAALGLTRLMARCLPGHPYRRRYFGRGVRPPGLCRARGLRVACPARRPCRPDYCLTLQVVAGPRYSEIIDPSWGDFIRYLHGCAK